MDLGMAVNEKEEAETHQAWTQMPPTILSQAQRPARENKRGRATTQRENPASKTQPVDGMHSGKRARRREAIPKDTGANTNSSLRRSQPAQSQAFFANNKCFSEDQVIPEQNIFVQSEKPS